METLLKVAPLAVVMVAGPQIISAIMLATSENPRRNSFAYVSGAVLASVLGTTVFFIVTGLLHTQVGAKEGGAGPIDYVLVALLLFLGVRVYLKRKTTEPPKWMAKLQTATPKFAFGLGFLLFIAMPTDLITMFTVGGYLAGHDLPLWRASPFLILTALFVGFPLIVLLLMGKRAATVLPKIRTWMSNNSWVVSEAVIVFFLLMELKTILGSG
jgi:hypothetical protein